MYSGRNSVPSYLEESDTNNIDTFTGLTADPFKSRYNNHTKSFRHKKNISMIVNLLNTFGN